MLSTVGWKEALAGRRSWLLRRENALMQAVYARRMWRLPPDPALAEALRATRLELDPAR
jgi:hypothetical protein